MTLFSDGLAARLLALNLIFRLEKKGLLDSNDTSQIFEKALKQAESFIERLDQKEDAEDKLRLDASWADVERASIEHAIDIIKINLQEIETARLRNAP
ncbi:hypothetical protein NZK33_11405 [Cyanobium sp. FGCU-6]|nr:hypothetical protein [Cyanobium sp. FGCU6]